MRDGAVFCGSRWVADPSDGVLCLTATKRTLDANGHCCDYERCAATITTPTSSRWTVVDRCLLLPGHDGSHHGNRCRRWADETGQPT